MDAYYEDKLHIPPDVDALLANLPPPDWRKEVCIKVEQENKNILRLEALALKKVQSCQQVVRFVSNGCVDGMNYLVMEKLGPNLTELRRRSPHGTFNIYTTLKAGISCLTAIRGVHEQGLVHRDIKPSNFITGIPGSPDRATCYLIDFGLARRYRRSNGELRPSRKNAGFRGTSRYASVASHRRLELGRVDDLWSLLFMLVEFATGTLPWRKYKDKDDIGRCKEESITPQLVRNLPREFQAFLAHLQTLLYEDEPDYDYLLSLIYRALARRGYPPNKPVDWELDPVTIEQVAEEEIRMSLYRRNDANKNHVEKRNHQSGGAPGVDAQREVPNAELKDHDSRPSNQCPPLKPSEVAVLGLSPVQEIFQEMGGDPQKCKQHLLPVNKNQPSRLVSPIQEFGAHCNSIHISEVELRHRRNGKDPEENKQDAVGSPVHSLRDASGAVWQEKIPECLAVGIRDNGATRKEDGLYKGKQSPPWLRESPMSSATVDMDQNNFSSRECSRVSNKHSFLGKKGKRKRGEKPGNSLSNSLFMEYDHQSSILHTTSGPCLMSHRNKHLDAIQKTTPDTNKAGSSKPLNDISGVKKKEKSSCKCFIM
ncbi:unnamed protein product [Phytomonas sp. Hart1]|nr:unnamed protein product [Phytomonas sp. Hart1]|eukprot:CCW66491.1 unnamed protein product [Phytomonas sp. isolate Hart1]